MNFEALLPLIRLCARDPVEGARQIVAARLPRSVLWMALGVMVAVYAILVTLFLNRFIVLYSADFPPILLEALESSTANPVLLALSQGIFLGASVFTLFRLGNALGGTGDFEGSIATIVLIQFFFMVFLAIQLVLLFTLPGLNALVGPLAFFYLLWLVPGFVMGLHGFKSRLLVLFMIFVSFFVLNFVLSLFFAIWGLETGGASNV